MRQQRTLKIIKISLGSLLLFLVPIYLLAEMALRITPEHEREAAFCLEILENGGSYVTFADGRAIQLLGERLSFVPDASSASHEGRLAAAGFLSEAPSPEEIANRLMVCRADLTEIIERYSWRSCGYGVGTLSEDWSMRDKLDFYVLTEGPIPEGGVLFLDLRKRLFQ